MSSEEIAFYLRCIANTLVVYWLVRMVRLHYTGWLFYKERYNAIPADHMRRLLGILSGKSQGSAGGWLFFLGIFLLFLGPLYMPGLPVSQRCVYFFTIVIGVGTEIWYDLTFISTAYKIKRTALKL